MSKIKYSYYVTYMCSDKVGSFTIDQCTPITESDHIKKIKEIIDKECGESVVITNFILLDKNLEYLHNKLSEAINLIKDVAKYDTCHKCEYKLGGAPGPYCIAERDGITCNTPDYQHYSPVSKTKQKAREFLEKHCKDKL